MSSIEDQPNLAARRGARARALTVLAAALALLIGLAALALHLPAQRDRASPAPASEHASPVIPPAPASPSPASEDASTGSAFEPGSLQPGGSAPTGPEARAGVAARLREILRVREQAFGRRDAGLLETVYAADCPCLRAGRTAIARLLTERVRWRGRAIAVQVSSVGRVSDRVWVAVGLLSSGAFRIEREDGVVIRAVPAERRRYRFVLVQPAPNGRWLLGDASLLEEGGP
jgi:hypothetical protein